MITLDKITNKIMAIKAIKELPVAIDYVTVENGVLTPNLKINLGLKEAKDLVEVIIALGTNPDYENLQKRHNELLKNYSELDDKYYGLCSAIRNIVLDNKIDVSPRSISDYYDKDENPSF